ncbi:MAG: LytTR family transcriptional regulator DNA-binding domain-containing protein [Clostridia bacterium]|nr:LytTR family transcriptional regulator DNA-binding domain-containing protein [Clostridia bacterium]
MDPGEKRKVQIRFEQVDSIDGIDVLVRARDRGEEVEHLLARIAGQKPEALTVTDEHGALLRLDPDGIVSVSIDGRQVRIAAEGGSYRVRQSLQSLEESLDPDKFVRISRYELVNLDKVSRYDFTLSGTLRLELADGQQTWASRRCIPAIRRRLYGKE